MAFSDLDSIREHRQRALAYITMEVGGLLDSALADADVDTESPIEAIFTLWWTVLSILNVYCVRELNLQPQHPVKLPDGRVFRLDFSVTPDDAAMWNAAADLGIRYQLVGVEVDGHDFHERTKEQVAERNARDRALQSAGWQILHFSGSELYRDPAAVVTEVANVASHALNSLRIRYLVKSRGKRDGVKSATP